MADVATVIHFELTHMRFKRNICFFLTKIPYTFNKIGHFAVTKKLDLAYYRNIHQQGFCMILF